MSSKVEEMARQILAYIIPDPNTPDSRVNKRVSTPTSTNLKIFQNAIDIRPEPLL